MGFEDSEKGSWLLSLLVARRGGYRVIFKPAYIPSRELEEDANGPLLYFVLLLSCIRATM